MTLGYRFGNAELRPQHRMLLVGDKPARVGARAFDLLLALFERRERIVAKNELLDLVWPGLVVEENNLQVHISSLRKLLGPHAIATVPGRGYRFTAALEHPAASEAAAGTSGAHAGKLVPPRAAAIGASTNLPAELPQLYGRDGDLATLRTLAASHRLVTLVGAGGIGKTALAQALAHASVESFSDGAWLVELAPVTDPSAVASTVAGVLQVAVGAQDQPVALARALGASRMLVVLDNCEHLARGVAEVAEALLRTTPHVRLIATSQEPLKLAQEHLFRLGPLELPQDDAGADARHAGAVAMFEARARTGHPGFVVDERNAAAVADICRHLDGIPLAIELAAARLPLLGLEGLRARLDERFRLLTQGTRLALPRHQTLRAAMDWSHGLLTADEQSVFRRLSIFSGSFGLDSAQRVGADERIDAWAVLEHLGALVDKSLVVADLSDVPRYRLLETARAFGHEKLQDAEETDAASRSHAQATLAVFECSWDEEYLLSRQARLQRYLPDLDNGRAALGWSAASEPGLHVALAGAMAWIWVRAGFRAEGIRRLRAAMQLVDASTPPTMEARLVGAWPALAYPEVGPLEIASGQRAVELFRTLGHGQAQRQFCALCDLVRSLRAAPEQADRAMQEAERLFDPAWPPSLRAPLLTARANIHGRRGEHDQCLALHGELHRLAVSLGDQRLVLMALINGEQSAAALGRWQEAADRGHELLAHLGRERSLRSGTEVIVLANLCMALTELGQVDEALAMARRAYALNDQAGNALWLLDPLGRLAFRRGAVEDAARVLGRADMRYATANQRRPFVESTVRAKLLLDLRQVLAATDLQRLMQDGEALTDDEAARLALSDRG